MSPTQQLSVRWPGGSQGNCNDLFLPMTPQITLAFPYHYWEQFWVFLMGLLEKDKTGRAQCWTSLLMSKPSLCLSCYTHHALKSSHFHCHGHRQCRSSTSLVASWATATKQNSHLVSGHDLFVYFHTQLERATFIYASTSFNWLCFPGLFLEIINWSFDPHVY